MMFIHTLINISHLCLCGAVAIESAKCVGSLLFFAFELGAHTHTYILLHGIFDKLVYRMVENPFDFSNNLLFDGFLF